MCRGVVLLSDHVRPVCNRSEKTVHIYKFNRPRLLFHPKEVKTRPRCMNMKRKSVNFLIQTSSTDVNLENFFFCFVFFRLVTHHPAYTQHVGHLSSETFFREHHIWLR